MNIIRCRCGRLALVTADDRSAIVPHKIDGKRCAESESSVEPESVTTIAEVIANRDPEMWRASDRPGPELPEMRIHHAWPGES